MTKDILSYRIKNIKPSPTIAVTSKARELKEKGKDIIGLGAGEPDFDSPEHIKNAAISAIKQGKTKYTAVDGISALKEAIKNKFKNDNNLEYSLEEISVGTGGKQVLYNVFQATLNKDDEVIIPAPYWVSYPDMVMLADGKPVILPTKPENNFKIDLIDLEKSINPKTKWIILNSPSNPTGTCYDRYEIERIGEVLEKYSHVNIISDDIYEKILYSDKSYYTIAQFSSNLKNRTLTVNGVSKAFSMTGWRIGYAGGPSAIIKAMAKIQSQSTSNPTSISQYAALEALTSSQDFIIKNCEVFKVRRNLITEIINNIDGLDCNTPEGAFYIFPSINGILGKKSDKGNKIKDSTSFSEFLLDQAGVAVVPGIAFGMEGHFRISYATSEEVLIEAGKRIAEACKKIY